MRSTFELILCLSFVLEPSAAVKIGRENGSMIDSGRAVNAQTRIGPMTRCCGRRYNWSCQNEEAFHVECGMWLSTVGTGEALIAAAIDLRNVE